MWMVNGYESIIQKMIKRYEWTGNIQTYGPNI